MTHESAYKLLEKIAKGYLENKPHNYPHFTINGEQFVLYAQQSTKDKNKFRVCLWYENGMSSLYSDDFPATKTLEENLNIAAERLVDYLNGYVHCSDCGAKFPASEVEGYHRSYFAGKYCQHCWDTKWAAIEAQETYD